MTTYRIVTHTETWTKDLSTEAELIDYLKVFERSENLIRVEKFVEGPGVLGGWYRWTDERNLWYPI